ncbi:MAG: S8/S53 family peptidase [Candidatus Eremiobacteraeota bacterium]|nr:S8/S53 family peptidase [Candidatus Eremiobacteraeota bacterium]
MKKILGSALTAVLLTGCSGGLSRMLPPATATGGASGAANAARAARAAIVAPAGWSTTLTQGLSVAGGTDNGALDPATKLTVRVALNLRNESDLQHLIASGQKISPSQFASQYGPAASDLQAMASYLQSNGLSNIEVGSQMVSADGTAAQVTKAFNTTLHSFSTSQGNVYANVAPAFVPSSFDGKVAAVLGLSNATKMSVTPHLSKSVSCFPTATPTGQCVPLFQAADVQRFYDATNTPAATGTTIAVIAEGNVSQVVTDLRLAESVQGLPTVPVTVVTVGLPSPDTSGGGEWDLDTQSSTGMAQNVSMLYIYATTSLTDSDIAHNYQRWVQDDKAQLGNSSFGECEYAAYLDGSMAVDDHLFEQGAAQGQTMMASTGDTGSSCAVVGTNGAPGSGPPMVSYPATSPWVLGVGGTSAISNADGSYSGETAWNAGGGGLSQFENSTQWQQVALPTHTGLAATNLRGLPDVAMAADPNLGGYNVYGQNIPGVGACSSGCGIGGTSEASPLTVGSLARLLTAHPGLGYLPPHLYANWNANQNNTATVTGPPPTQTLGGFHDIITGANGAYQALPGYDYTTGMGTLDISVMNGQIQ